MSRAIAIKRLTVTKPGQRVFFELKIPCGCDRVDWIGATIPTYTGALDTGPLGYVPRTAGQVKLKWQEKGDIFFACEVDLIEHAFRDELLVDAKYRVLPFGLDKGVFQWGKRMGPLSVCIDQRHTHLRGSYTDILNTQLVTPQHYGVNIYVHCSKGGGR